MLRYTAVNKLNKPWEIFYICGADRFYCLQRVDVGPPATSNWNL